MHLSKVKKNNLSLTHSKAALGGAGRDKFSDTLSYVLDQDNLIISIEGAWDEFVIRNDGDSVFKNEVLGKPLLNFISGKVTKQYWLDLIDKARTSGKVMSIDFRCDAPFERRFMRMTLQPENTGVVRLSTICIAKQRRARHLYFRCAKERTKNTILRCSNCNRLRVKENWLEADEFVLHQKTSCLDVIYGVCQDCQSLFKAASNSLLQ